MWTHYVSLNLFLKLSFLTSRGQLTAEASSGTEKWSTKTVLTGVFLEGKQTWKEYVNNEKWTQISD